MNAHSTDWRSVVPASALVLATSLHSWPVADVPALRFFWPVNIVFLAWLAWMLPRCVRRDLRDRVRVLLPPTCLWAYVAVCVLSIAVPEGMGRPLTAAAKMALCVVGGYVLMRAGLQAPPMVRALPVLWGTTVSVVLLHAVLQASAGESPVAFFESPLKLGSFLALAVPLAAGLLISHGHASHRVWASLLVIAGLLVCQSVWAWFGILAGTAAASGSAGRRWLAVTLLSAVTVASVAAIRPGTSALVRDSQWREDSGTDVRQRYLEWQALINLLEDRGATGTGIGCLNELRSQYYFRLPKRNTIATFDQNGYLATAAELGIPGLVVFCWIAVEYLARGWNHRDKPLARAAASGLLGGLIAHCASSLAYNGILIVLVVLLATIDHAEGRARHASA